MRHLHALFQRQAAILAQFFDNERRIAEAFLAAAEPSATAVDVYGSRPPYQAPPGRSHRWLRVNARKIPGSLRRGGKRGRGVLWTVSRSYYETWEAERSLRTVETVNADSAVVINVDPDSWIRAAGYRPGRPRGSRP